MARNFNGGTDRIHWYDSSNMNGLQYETISFWFKTTQNANNVHIASQFSSGSRAGWLFAMTSGLVYCSGWAALSPPRINMSTVNTTNDGNWHHIMWAARRAGGFSGNAVYVDGSLVASANPSGDWYTNSGYYCAIGDSFDAYWGTFVGDIAEFAHWRNVLLGAGEAAALAKGFSPLRVRPAALDIYAPLVRDARSIASPSRTPVGLVSVTGTTVTDHPRVYA